MSHSTQKSLFSCALKLLDTQQFSLSTFTDVIAWIGALLIARTVTSRT